MRKKFNILLIMTSKLLLSINFKRTGLLTFILATNLFIALAQDSLTINGVVVSGQNQPLSNVSVSIEGSTQLPVVTNDSGKFSLNSATGNEWVIISPAGAYKAKRIYLNNRKELKIFVTPSDLLSEDDKFSILSQQIQRRNMVAAYSEPNIENIHHSTSLSIDQYMQGKVAGALVINRSGMPGSGASVLIRGVHSLNTNNQPLYVVDGIPITEHRVFGSNLAGYEYNSLIGINPFDISQTTVVKDPAISAAYGSKGSNGLVLIETLAPSATQTTINLEYRTGVSLAPARHIPQLNADQHKTLMNEVLYSSGLYEENIQELYPTLFLTPDDDRYIDYQHNTNWQNLIFKNSRFNTFNVNVKGGDEIARYGLSFGYVNNKGIIKSTGFEGYDLRFVSRLNIFRWLKMNAGVSLNYNNADLKEAATVKETSPILAGLAKSPLLNPYQYDINGNEIKTLSEVDEIGVSNPLAIIENYEASNNNYNFIATADLEAIITKHMSLKSKFGLTYNVLKEQIFMPNHGMERYYNKEAINVAKGTNNNMQSVYNNTYFAFNKSLNKDHVITSNTGVNVQINKFQLDWGIGKNAHESDQYRTLQDGQSNLKEMGGQNRNWNWLSAYENLFYAFRDKYLFSGSVSLDFSSRVGKDAINTIKLGEQPFGLFYSGGIAWRLSNEAFLKDYSWLENLKLRIAMGKTGNDDIGESSATNYYNTIKFRETAGLFPALLPNTELSYENVYQTNAGIDLALWGSRLTTNIDVYTSKTNNMLIYSPVESYLGYDLRVENGGKLKNSGWEVSAFVRLIDKNAFKWDITANISSFKNKITAIKGDKLVTKIQGAEIINEVGSSANSFYGYQFKGVFSSQTEAVEANLVNDKNIAFQAGDAIFEDISGPNGTPDGVINNYDKTIIGSALPKYFGGLINSFTYKRWTLRAFVQFISGNDVFNYVRFKNEQMTGLENQSKTVLNRWQYNGQVTSVPRALGNDPVGNSSFSTRWIEDGSFVRVKNISLTYKIPDKLLIFRNAELYVAVNNAFTFTKYLGYDPEFAYSFSPLYQGIDYGQSPQPRQFIAGIRIGL